VPVNRRWLAAATGVAVVVAVGLTAYAWIGTTSSREPAAPSPPSGPAATLLDGHYIDTETNPHTGQSVDNDWYLTPCGDGCASVTVNGRDMGEARLVDRRWTLTIWGHALCPDKTIVLNSNTDHYTWDPNTLAGTNEITTIKPACDNPAGVSENPQYPTQAGTLTFDVQVMCKHFPQVSAPAMLAEHICANATG
jgi:hypothetical protein